MSGIMHCPKNYIYFLTYLTPYLEWIHPFTNIILLILIYQMDLFSVQHWHLNHYYNFRKKDFCHADASLNCTFYFSDFSSYISIWWHRPAAVYNDWQIILIESARRLLEHSKFLFTSIFVIHSYEHITFLIITYGRVEAFLNYLNKLGVTKKVVNIRSPFWDEHGNPNWENMKFKIMCIST